MVILLQLFMIDNCADDWRIAMTWQRMMQIGKHQDTIFPCYYVTSLKVNQTIKIFAVFAKLFHSGVIYGMLTCLSDGPIKVMYLVR